MSNDPVQVWPEEFAQRYRQQGYWRGETFASFIRDRARNFADRTAVVGRDTSWTYAQLLQKAETAAAGFVALGLKPGERVVVQVPNIPEFLSVVFGLFLARLVPVYALPAHRLTEVAHFADKSNASAYVIAASHDGFDYRKLAREVLGQAKSLRQVIVATGEAEEFVDTADFTPAPESLPADAAPSDVAFLQISGGSTGLSKLIPRTHDDYIYSFRASAEICGLNADSSYLVALPAAHNFPMSSPGYFGTLYMGGKVVMSHSPEPETAFSLIEREKVTITGLVPPLALLWLQAAPVTKYDISSLQVLQVGGAKLIPEVAKRVQPVLGCALQQVFGMAEGLVNYTRLDDPEQIIIETQGRPISSDDEVLIVDDDGNPVAPGEAGNLLTRGPYTIRAYHNDEAANRRAFTADGYYRTGDVVKRTGAGYLVVQGRATDHINRAGEKISAEEIEDHLLAHPAVFDAAVVSIPDEFLGERSCAFVVANAASAGQGVGQDEQKPPRAAALKAFMRDRNLAAFKVPDQIVFVNEFSTTAVGKVSRKELRARLRAEFLDRQSPQQKDV